jgi:hypothetical protein
VVVGSARYDLQTVLERVASLDMMERRGFYVLNKLRKLTLD